jgi:hypothetical protein
VLRRDVDVVSSGFSMGRFMFTVVLPPASSTCFSVESEGERSQWAYALRQAADPAAAQAYASPRSAIVPVSARSHGADRATSEGSASTSSSVAPVTALPKLAPSLTASSASIDADSGEESGGEEVDAASAATPAFIPDISGVWEADAARSDSLDPMFQLMGLGWVLRKIACSVTAVSTYTYDRGTGGRPPSITNVSVTSVGSETKIYVLDGQPHKVKGADGKVCRRWRSTPTAGSNLTLVDAAAGGHRNRCRDQCK